MHPTGHPEAAAVRMEARRAIPCTEAGTSFSFDNRCLLMEVWLNLVLDSGS